MSTGHTPARSKGGAFSVDEFCAAYSIGRSMAYKEIREGRLKIIKVGHRTLITVTCAEAWVNAHGEA